MKRLFIAVCALALGTALTIDGAEAAAVEGLDFDRADANQDGVIDRAEYQSLSGEEQQ